MTAFWVTFGLWLAAIFMASERAFQAKRWLSAMWTALAGAAFVALCMLGRVS